MKKQSPVTSTPPSDPGQTQPSLEVVLLHALQVARSHLPRRDSLPKTKTAVGEAIDLVEQAIAKAARSMPSADRPEITIEELARINALAGICGDVGSDNEALELWDKVFACKDNHELYKLDETHAEGFLSDEIGDLQEFKASLTSHRDFVLPYLARAARLGVAALTVTAAPDSAPDDAIQFTRFIAELQAAGALDKAVISQAADSMDLDPKDVRELIERAIQAHTSGSSTAKTKCPRASWQDNTIQFPRLIAELEGVGAFSPETIDEVSAAMTLPQEALWALIDRAQAAWDGIKAATGIAPPSAGRPK